MDIVQWIITGLMGVVMGYWKMTSARQEKELDQVKLDIQHIRDTRLHKDDFREFKIELRGLFEEIKQDIRDLKNQGR